MSLDRPGDDPNQISRGGGVDAEISIGPDLVAQCGHFLFALSAEDQDRLLGPACPISFDQIQGIEFAGQVADQHGVENFVPQSGQSGRRAQGLFQLRPARSYRPKVLRSAKRPVRSRVVIYNILMRGGS